MSCDIAFQYYRREKHTFHENENTHDLFHPHIGNRKSSDSLLPRMKKLSDEFIEFIEVSSTNKSLLNLVQEIKTKIQSAPSINKKMKKKINK